MLHVQKFLMSNTFGDLERQHGVEISVDSRHGHKFSLNYSQINSVDSDLLSQQCRGLILSNGRSLFEQAKIVNRKKDYSHICPGQTTIIALPMFRFFNHGQGAAASINWSDPKLKIYEKLDGSLLIMSFDHIINEWHASTRSCPEADIPLEFNKYTFRTLFEKALENARNISFKDFTKKLNPNYTYCFELTSPLNRIIVKYSDYKIHLLSIRDNISFKEIEPSTDVGCGSYIPLAPTYNIGTIEQAIEYVNSCNPMNNEGVVLCDGEFNRVKIKNASYVALNRCRDSLSSSPRGCLELVLAEKADDVVSFMPDEIAKNLLTIKTLVLNFINNFEQDYRNINISFALRRETDVETQSWNDQKLFADCVGKSKIWSSPCFKIFANKADNLKHFIKLSSKNGSWSNSFLDSLLVEIGYCK